MLFYGTAFGLNLKVVYEGKNLTVLGTQGEAYGRVEIPTSAGVEPTDYVLITDNSNTYPAGIRYAPEAYLGLQKWQAETSLLSFTLANPFVNAYPPTVNVLVLRTEP